MFAYCGNNPVSMSDPMGNLPDWIKDFVKWTTEYVIKPAASTIPKVLSNFDLTYSTGFNISGTPSAWIFNGQIGISMDTEGNVAIQASGGGGVTGGATGISVTGYQSITNAIDIDKLQGDYYQLGGAIGVLVYGLPLALGGEFYVEWGTTKTFYKTQFNIYDVVRNVYKKIMEW